MPRSLQDIPCQDDGCRWRFLDDGAAERHYQRKHADGRWSA